MDSWTNKTRQQRPMIPSSQMSVNIKSIYSLALHLRFTCASLALNRHIVLYCIVLYCIVLYCIVLYCSVLYCIVLYGYGMVWYGWVWVWVWVWVCVCAYV